MNKWFGENKPSLNSKKTKSILFCGSRSKFKGHAFSITGNDKEIEAVSDMKYLGLLGDRHLTFERHANSVCSKVAMHIGLLLRIRAFIDVELAKILYTSLIYPHFCMGTL